MGDTVRSIDCGLSVKKSRVSISSAVQRLGRSVGSLYKESGLVFRYFQVD
jgi:hypothetical protein